MTRQKSPTQLQRKPTITKRRMATTGANHAGTKTVKSNHTSIKHLLHFVLIDNNTVIPLKIVVGTEARDYV